MTRLTLLRHGQTDWNRDRRIQGATDIPLNDEGRAQARAAAMALSDDYAAAAPIIVTSDLVRASETAEIVAGILAAAPPTTDAVLRERAYGEAEGLDVDVFRERWGQWHAADVPGAETPEAVRRRVVRGILRIVRAARHASAPRSPDVLLVTHGGVIREVIRHATGGERPGPGERLTNASAHRFIVEHDHMRLVSADLVETVPQ